ncbi:MAG: TRAP transporter small permease subunit [Pseudomonadota bacterium]
MIVLWGPLRLLTGINSFILRIGRFLAWTALALMVVVILIQVVYRYIPTLDALPWPEEAARFLMLWMTGLIAPSAYRWGGFVAIDMVPRALPQTVAAILMLALLALSAVVLIVAIYFGSRHVSSGCLFNSATLYVPFDLKLDLLSPCSTPFFEWGGFAWARVKLAWMYLSLLVGVCLMLAVNVELILRSLILLFDPEADVPIDRETIAAGAD